jgi:tRNA(Ile)-lysidine synthase TilS/MesJ
MENDIKLSDYDKFIVSFSGGKDSSACFLYLLECGNSQAKNRIVALQC